MIDEIIVRKEAFDLYEYSSDRIFRIERRDFDKINQALIESELLFLAESNEFREIKG